MILLLLESRFTIQHILLLNPRTTGFTQTSNSSNCSTCSCSISATIFTGRLVFPKVLSRLTAWGGTESLRGLRAVGLIRREGSLVLIHSSSIGLDHSLVFGAERGESLLALSLIHLVQILVHVIHLILVHLILIKTLIQI